MTQNSRSRERLTDLTFAMRIVATAFSEDMTILLNCIQPRDATSQVALRKAAALSAEFARQTRRYSDFVEKGTTGRRP